MKRLLSLTTFFFVLTFCLTAQPDIELEQIATGFFKPVDISHAGDDRLFITQQNGIIRIIDENGDVLPTPFLNISGPVNDGANERGLLGLAFHPDYANNGFFFVNYTGPGGGDTYVSRYSVSADPNVADADSEEVLLTIDQPFNNHNGGCIKFGPDGYLYIGNGDGGAGGDPNNAGQNPMSLLGKMLRIDVDNGSPYSIPADNPYAGALSIENEIWAFGVRNPWRFSFDRETGDMWIGDVGQGDWEEIDFQPASSIGGENYGWRCYEGDATYNTSNCGNMTDYAYPLHVYPSVSAVGVSVTGGFVYRGNQFQDMQGYYFYGDYASGRIWAILPDDVGGYENWELLNWNNNQISSFGENVDGELFMCAHAQGAIYQIRSACALSVSATTSDESCFGSYDGSITLDINGAVEPITIAWDFPGTSFDSLTAGVYNVSVTDAVGCVSSVQTVIDSPNPVQPDVSFDGFILTAEGGFASYQWFLNGNPINGATDQSFTPTENGIYTVEATDDVNCSGSSDEIEVVVNSLNELPGTKGISIMPNPVVNNLRLEILSDNNMQLDIKILDATGKTVLENSTQISGNYVEMIDMSHLPKGIYFLNLENEKGKAVERIVKQ